MEKEKREMHELLEKLMVEKTHKENKAKLWVKRLALQVWKSIHLPRVVNVLMPIILFKFSKDGLGLLHNLGI